MQNININGSDMIRPGIYENITICGSSNCFGNIQSNYLEINGKFLSDGNIDCKKLIVNGYIKAIEIEAEEIEINGVVESNKLSSKKLNIKPNGLSNIGMILCDELTVASTSKLFRFFKNNRSVIIIDYIECIKAKLNNVKIKTLKCNNLKAGKNIQINKLICSENNMKNNKEIIDGGKYNE